MSELPFSLEWERLGNEGAGGWLVRIGASPAAMALSFVPDAEGRWDGEDFGEDDYEYEEEEEEEDEDEDGEDEEDADEDED